MNTPQKKYIVGLTGGIGSGKSTIAKKFLQYDIEYIDADDVAREVVAVGSSCLKQIAAHYGGNILLSDGSLNRKKLRHIIFNDVTEKEWLEALTHPAIHNKLKEHLSNTKSLYVLLVHPLLFETKKSEICDYTIAITLPKETQVKRVCSRDKMDEEMANTIISSQMSDLERRKSADSLIENGGCQTNLDDKVLTLHQQLSALANAKNN